MKYSKDFMKLKKDMRYCAKSCAAAIKNDNECARWRMVGYYCGLLDQALDDGIITLDESFVLDKYFFLLRRYYLNK